MTVELKCSDQSEIFWSMIFFIWSFAVYKLFLKCQNSIPFLLAVGLDISARILRHISLYYIFWIEISINFSSLRNLCSSDSRYWTNVLSLDNKYRLFITATHFDIALKNYYSLFSHIITRNRLVGNSTVEKYFIS